MSEPQPPTGTYRLQLTADFGFAQATAIVPYLADLGISHLYLSPVLQAAPGSMHGYDVVDHSRVSTDLGGEGGLVTLSESAHAHGMGVVVDVVPNHMTLPTPLSLNRQLWETLRLGREAPSASWFDVDWELCGGRIGLPVLGAPLSEILARGELALEELDGEPVVRYYDQTFPVAPGTGQGDVDHVLAGQHYVLADWRSKDEVLGYRRFFDVDTLVAVRVELTEVFDATHAVLVDLHRRGVIDGFRIDHPDGLADPQDYLERLDAATGGAWVVVEKILGAGETLPEDWQTAGTTGYDATTAIQAALAPPTAAKLDELWREVEGSEPSLHQTERDAKQLVLDALLQPEVQRLVRRAASATRSGAEPLTDAELAEAWSALLVHVEVYRAYVRLDDPPSATATQQVEAMQSKAVADRPDLAAALTAVCALVLDSTSRDPDVRDLVVRFQQVCGPVMAKGVEDTTFYRWHRLIALNEVGGDPLSLEHASADALHTWARQQDTRWPDGMTTLSTHDTKRGEDTRAQLLAAGEDIDGWRRVWELVRQQAAAVGVDEPTAYLLMQTVVGAWPIDSARLSAYAVKAVREAKQHTTWSDPDASYEQRVIELGGLLVNPGSETQGAANALADAIAGWVAALEPSVRANTLAAKLLQLTLPGVPDVYQGCETVERFLVDPDNRRPVDFASRQTRLTRLTGGESRNGLDDEKIWVTSRALRLRRDQPELFGARASYRPIETSSPHLLGFMRAERLAVVTTRWPRALSTTGWSGATLDLPDGEWVDLLTGERHAGGPRDAAPECRHVFSELPVALLLREGE